MVMHSRNHEGIFMKQVICNKRGVSVVELIIYTLISALVLGLFVFLLWRTRMVHEQQNVEITYQASFAKICEQLGRDLAGCRSCLVQNMTESDTSLFIERFEGDITYDVQLEAGKIIRNTASGPSVFAFKGERKRFLKYVGFTRYADNANTLGFKVKLETVPPIELSHDFSIRISVDNSGFFKEPKLDEREREKEAKAGIGTPPDPGCPRPNHPSAPGR